LQNNHARWYDGTTGRWMTQDPLGFAAGDSNLYRYVHNQPTGATDPSGLTSVSEATVGDMLKDLGIREGKASEEAYIKEIKGNTGIDLGSEKYQKEKAFAASQVNQKKELVAMALYMFTRFESRRKETFIQKVDRQDFYLTKGGLDNVLKVDKGLDFHFFETFINTNGLSSVDTHARIIENYATLLQYKSIATFVVGPGLYDGEDRKKTGTIFFADQKKIEWKEQPAVYQVIITLNFSTMGTKVEFNVAKEDFTKLQLKDGIAKALAFSADWQKKQETAAMDVKNWK
jgi:hypothetical protein